MSLLENSAFRAGRPLDEIEGIEGKSLLSPTVYSLIIHWLIIDYSPFPCPSLPPAWDIGTDSANIQEMHKVNLAEYEEIVEFELRY